MLKRHEIEILLKAGHAQTEVARLAGVSLCSVKRIAEEAPVVHVDDAAEREKRRIGRPSKVDDFRKFIVALLESPAYLRWKFFGGFVRPAIQEARPPYTLWWPPFVRRK